MDTHGATRAATAAQGRSTATTRRSILFVSGTSVGGANRSTHELAATLLARGHRVAVLSTIDEARRVRRLHKRLLDAAVRLGGPIGSAVHSVRRRVGRRRHGEAGFAYPVWRSAIAENALDAAIAETRPDVVVASSIERPAWRQIHASLERLGLASVLYLRERTALGHLVQSQVAPDVVVANSEGHASEARAAGYDAVVVPSIVDVANCRIEPTRSRVVFVNPVPLFGLDIALGVAAARPDIPFTFARSWPLEADEEQALLTAAAALGNVVVADPVPDPKSVYREARIVLVPYRHPGRPRVVAEAHACGIPVLGSDGDGTAEAIGPAGLVVSLDAPIDEWTAALGALWDDHDRYEQLVRVAQEWAARPEMQIDTIATAFEGCLDRAVDRRSAGTSPANR